MSERNAGESEYDALEDEFAHLFRDDAPPAQAPSPPPLEAPAPAAIDEGWDPLIPIPTAGDVDPPLPPPVAEQAEVEVEDVEEIEIAEEVELGEEAAEPIPAAPPADPAVGRLFRSRGAPEVADAITAVGSMQARRLRTMARADEPTPAPAPPPPAAEPQWQAAAPLPVAASGEPAPALQVMADPAAATSRSEQRGQPEQPRRPRGDRSTQRQDEGRVASSSGTLTGLGVYAVTIGVTVILAFGETLFFGGEPGVITGIGLLVVSVFAAFAVRTRDAVNAIFAPPIAFFIAAVTAGQVGLNANDLSGRLVALFFLLGASWIWIVGSTVAALVIVALRRRLG